MSLRPDLERQLRLTYALSERAASQSVVGYLKSVVIDSRPDPRRFGDVADPWQWETMGPILPAMESVAGFRTDYTGPRSFWRTLTRGSDKTSSIGRLMNWLLGFSRRRLSMCVGAGDSDQAQLIVEAMLSEARHNPWLERRVKHHAKTVRGPGGVMRVLTADAPSSFGRNDDVTILDEPTHWKKRDLFDVLWSGREKRPGSIFIIITNAGTLGSWQDEIRQLALKDRANWDVYEAPGPLASWMTLAAVERLRSMLPRGLAKRVLDNRWIDPAEEADYLTRLEIAACEDHTLTFRTTGSQGNRYVAGIDYGPRRDRTALCVLHRTGGLSRIEVDRLDVWQGSPESPIQVQAVDEWIGEQVERFPGLELVIDPYQMEGLIQKWEPRVRVERFEARGGKANYEMAETLRSLIHNRMIGWYPGAGVLNVSGRLETLTDEIAGLVIVPTPYGYRFDHKAEFHDDRAVALGMAALHACRMDPSAPGLIPEPLSKREFLRPEKRQPTFQRRGLWGTG